MTVTLPVTIIAAVILLGLTDSSKIKGDAAIAMISVGALALGYLLLNIFSASANVSGDVCTTLFGSTSILTLSQSDVLLCALLAIIVLVVFILFYHKLFAVTFDESFSRATGLKVEHYNTLLAILTALTIVLGMRMMGAMLISSLVIFPALTAMRLFKSFRGVVLSAAVTSVLCFITGLAISFAFSTPVGATVVAANLVLFLLACLYGLVSR